MQDLLLPTIHNTKEFAASPLQGRSPQRRDTLAFFRGETGNHRSGCRNWRGDRCR